MRGLLLFLAVMAAAFPAWSRPRVTPPNPTRPYAVTVEFATGDTTDSEAIPVSGFCTVRYEQVSGDDASLYAVTTDDTAASSGTLIKAFTASSTTATTFTAGTRWVKAVATDATAGGSVMTIECAPATGSGSGGNVDADGNGLYEVATLIDADGDGSGYVTCTAKDTPDSACKVAGEVIYRDFSDDVNCMIRGCGSRPALMEPAGVIFLRSGVYVNFPCWRPGGTNDPTTPATHDSTSDDAYGDCPAGEDGLAQTQLSLAGWGGEIIGMGLPGGRSDTTSMTARGYGRTDATYIVNDLGNREDAYFISGTTFHKSVGFGYALQSISVSRYGQGAFTSTTGLGGWGEIAAITGSSDEIEDNSTAIMCVCTTTSGSCSTSATDSTTGSRAFDIQSVTTSTHLILEQDANSGSTKSVVTVLTPKSAPPYVQGICDDANTVAVPVGLTANGYTGKGSLPAIVEDVIDDTSFLYIAREDYFASNAQISNVVFEPQDWWGEPGGDCADTGLFTAGTASTDSDCDTQPLVSIHGYNGRTALKNVAFRYWNEFGIDGEVTAQHGFPLLDQVLFQYGVGPAIADPGYGWRYQGITVRDTVFSGNVIANFGQAQIVDEVLVANSVFDSVISLTDVINSTFRKIRIESSNFAAAVSIGCGVRDIRIDDVYATGRMFRPRTSGQMLGLVSIECDTETKPTSNIWLSNLREDPPGSGVQVAADTYTNGGSQVLVEVRISDTDEWNNIQRIFLSDSSLKNDRISDAGGGWTSRQEGCLVGIQDRTAAGGAGSDGLLGSDGTGGSGGELDTLREFYLTNNVVKGQLFCEFGSGGYYDDVDTSCTDMNSSGGPPQTTGGPDGLCDSDGSTAVTHDSSDSALFDAHRTLMRARNVEY